MLTWTIMASSVMSYSIASFFLVCLTWPSTISNIEGISTEWTAKPPEIASIAISCGSHILYRAQSERAKHRISEELMPEVRMYIRVYPSKTTTKRKLSW